MKTIRSALTFRIYVPVPGDGLKIMFCPPPTLRGQDYTTPHLEAKRRRMTPEERLEVIRRL